MRNLFISVFVAMVGLSSCREDDITGTVKKCKDINEHLSSYKQKAIDLTGVAEQNGTVTGYFKDKELIMASVANFGESNRRVDEFYFDDEKLICINREEFTYNKPRYYTEDVAQKSGDSVWYDDKKTVMQNTRFYFYDNRMVKWIAPNNKEIPDNDRKYDYTERSLLNDAGKLVKMLKDQ